MPSMPSGYMSEYHDRCKYNDSGLEAWLSRVNAFYLFPSILDYGHVHYIQTIQNKLNSVIIDENQKR